MRQKCIDSELVTSQADVPQNTTGNLYNVQLYESMKTRSEL